MEYYTSILSVDKSKLESLYEKQIILAEIYERSKFIRVNEGLNELIETSEKCEKEEYRSVISLSLYDLIYPELEVKQKLLNVEKLKMFYIWILE